MASLKGWTLSRTNDGERREESQWLTCGNEGSQYGLVWSGFIQRERIEMESPCLGASFFC